jgi:unsaturated rhamnogalacturonyl hydrolase
LALYRPDAGTIRHSCWVDTIYHEPVFLAALGLEAGEDALINEALGVWSSHTRALSSDQGPFLAHSCESALGLVRGYGWGRGNAWAFLGMVDALEILPPGTAGHRDASQEFVALADALLDAQDRSGFWRTLLHDREAYLETSTAAMFGAAFTKARRLGLLDDPRLDEAIDRAWAATRSRIDQDGQVYGVSAWTHASITRDDHADYYRILPTEVNWWGQGAGLRAAAERLRAGLR